MKQTITWIGHGSWKMVTPKGTVVYLDPWIEGNPACPIKLEDTSDAELVCVTHGHSDHLGNAIEIVVYHHDPPAPYGLVRHGSRSSFLKKTVLREGMGLKAG